VEGGRWRLVGRRAGSERAPLASSAGRVCDAVASRLGIANVSSYEAEAAMQLEGAAEAVDPALGGRLPVAILEGPALRLDTPAMSLYMQHDRPGIVLELSNVNERAVLDQPTDTIIVASLQTHEAELVGV